MAIVSFTVGSVSYNAATASALEQDEVLSLIGLEVMRTVFSNTPDAKPEKALVPMFMTLPQGVKKRVSDILCSKLFVAGQTETTVSVHDFECRMVEWNQLLSELMVRNFKDFFIWQASERDADRQTPTA